MDTDGGEASQESTSVKVSTEMEDEDKTLPEGRKAEAADRVEKLRKRMLEERLRVINYLERKKEDETIIEIGKFWEEQNRKLFIQAGKEKAERLSMDKGIRAAPLQKDYQDRLKLDTNRLDFMVE